MSVVFPSRVGRRTTDEMDWYVRKFRLEAGEHNQVNEGDDLNEGEHVSIDATPPARASVREEILLVLKLIGMGASATALLYLLVLAINS